MPARVVVFGGDSASCISTELNTVGPWCPPLTLLPIFLSQDLLGRIQSLGDSHIPSPRQALPPKR